MKIKKLNPIILFVISFILSQIACEKQKMQTEKTFKVALSCYKDTCLLQIDSIIGTKIVHFHTYKSLDSMYKASFYYSRKLMPTQSIEILKEMEQIKEVQKNAELLAKVYGLMSNEYTYGFGDIAEGLKYNLETLKIYQKMKDNLKAKSYVGHAYLSMGNLKGAAVIYKELEDAYHKQELNTKQVNYQSYLISAQSELYIKLKQPEKVIEINKRFLKWLDKFEDKGDWDFMEIKRGGTFLNLSVAYMQKNKKDTAKYYLTLSDKILGKPIYEDIRSTQIYIHQFNLAMFLQNYDKARTINTNYAKKLDKDNKSRNVLLMENTARLKNVEGNYKEALRITQNLTPLRKEIFEKEKQQKIVGNYVLNTYNNQQKIIFKTKQKEQIIATSLGIFLFLSSVVILFGFYRIRINKKLKNVNKLIIKQKKQLDRYALFLTDLKKDKKREEKEIASKKLFEEVEKLLYKTMAFVNPNFNREELASSVNTNRQYLIEAIQSETHLNFNDYIKQKRMEFAYNLIQENPEYTQEELAKCCGYTNKRTFNRHFVEFYKNTPNYYKEKLNN